MGLDRNESMTINTTALVVSKDKQNATPRESIIIINTSTGGQKVTLAIDTEAVDGAGIVLYPGGSWQDSKETGYIPTQKLITAISDLAGGTIAIQERLGGN